MEYRQLGNSNLKVSPFCLGTMTFGTQCDENESFKILDYAFNNEVNFIDTAEQYPAPSTKEKYGLTEKIIGNWITKNNNRNKIIIATKMSGPGIPWIRDGLLQFSKDKIKQAVEQSLKRLNSEYIDLFQLHWPERFYKNYAVNKDLELKDEYNKFEDILGSFEDLIQEGKIRYLGLSNEDYDGLKNYLQIINKNNFSKIISMQNRFNLIFRNYDEKFIEICKKNNISVLGYSPLAFGQLTGKYINEAPINSRIKLYPKYFNRYSGNNSKFAISKYSNLSLSANLSLTDLSMSYCINHSFITSSIIGSTSVNQLSELLKSKNKILSVEILKKIKSIHNENNNPTLSREIDKADYLLNALKLLFKGDFYSIKLKIKKIFKK
tara:strand:+ start:268 stop:1404 length:1137 start_codon:yes stop_codon:yes gene_type:complete